MAQASGAGNRPRPVVKRREPAASTPAKANGASGAASAALKPVEVTFRRELGLKEAVLLGVGAMIGGGIFTLLGFAVDLAGAAVLIAFALNGLVMLLTVMTYAEFGAYIHEAGGGYRPVDMSMPPPFGFLAGWMAWFARSVACGLYGVTFGAFAIHLDGLNLQWLGLDPHQATVTWGIVVAVAFMTVNYIGTRVTAKTENILSIFQISVFALFVVAAAVYAVRAGPAPASFAPLFHPDNGVTGVFLAMALMYITFEGSELIATLAEEIKQPEKNIPRAHFMAIGITSAIYVTVAAAALAVLGWTGIRDSKESALIDANQVVLGQFGVVLIIIAGLVSALAAMNAALLASSRVAFAMGRRRHLPASFAKIHADFRTPSIAILATGAIIVFMVFLFPLERIAATASLLFLTSFVLVNMSIISLRYKFKRVPKRGFKIPLFPIPPLLAIAINAGLIGYIYVYELQQQASTGQAPVAIPLGVLWIAAGLFLYYGSRGREEAVEAFPVREAQKLPEPRFHVMVSVGGPIATRLMSVARDLAKARDGVVTLLNVIQLPRAMPVIGGVSKEMMEKRIDYLRRIDQRYPDVAANAAVVVSRDVAAGINGEVERRDVNLLVMGWKGTSVGSTRLVGSTLEPIIARGPCDILVLRSSGKERYRRIAVAALSPQAAHDVGWIAGAIARQHESTITVLHGPGVKQREIAEAIAEGATQAGASPNVKPREEEFYRMVVDEGAESDLVIVGTVHHTYRRGLFGDPLEDRIAVGVPCAVALFLKAVSPVSTPVPVTITGPGAGEKAAPPV